MVWDRAGNRLLLVTPDERMRMPEDAPDRPRTQVWAWEGERWSLQHEAIVRGLTPTWPPMAWFDEQARDVVIARVVRGPRDPKSGDAAPLLAWARLSDPEATHLTPLLLPYDVWPGHAFAVGRAHGEALLFVSGANDMHTFRFAEAHAIPMGSGPYLVALAGSASRVVGAEVGGGLYELRESRFEPSAAPGIRFTGSGIAWDETRGAFVRLISTSGERMALHALTAAGWEEIAPAADLSEVLLSPTIAVDPSRRQVVAYGGQNGRGRTWVSDGGAFRVAA